MCTNHKIHTQKHRVRHQVAQLAERATNIQRLCPSCSDRGLESNLQPLAACHPLLSHRVSSHLSLTKTVLVCPSTITTCLVRINP